MARRIIAKASIHTLFCDIARAIAASLYRAESAIAAERIRSNAAGMRQSCITPPKPITDPVSGGGPAATCGDVPALQHRSSHETDTPTGQLASDNSHGNDPDGWSVSDDWPEFVPIASVEVEAIEAFLRDAIDDLLKEQNDQS